jgi:hypothetical protein
MAWHLEKPDPVLSRLHAAPVFTEQELKRIAQRLYQWASGIALCALLACTQVAIWIFGFERIPATVWPAVAWLGIAWLAWALRLTTFAQRPHTLVHIRDVLWWNALTLVGLSTALIGASGGARSPLFWLYMPLIAVELLQNHRRGRRISWLAWGLYSLCVFGLLGNTVYALPHPVQALWSLYLDDCLNALGGSAWLLLVALLASCLSRYLNQVEHELEAWECANNQKELTINKECERLKALQQALNVRLARLKECEAHLQSSRMPLHQGEGEGLTSLGMP